MIKAILALAVVAGAIALGVKWISDEGTSQGPTTVKVEVPDPMGGDSNSGKGDEIYVP